MLIRPGRDTGLLQVALFLVVAFHGICKGTLWKNNMKCMWYCRLEHAIDMAVTRVCIPLLCDDVNAGRCKHKCTPKPAHG